MPGQPRGIYRVRVKHADTDHPMSAEAFYGSAFDTHYEQTAREITGGPVDLVEHARKCADRCRTEYPDSDGYVTRVVQLHDDQGEGTWEEVE